MNWKIIRSVVLPTNSATALFIIGAYTYFVMPSLNSSITELEKTNQTIQARLDGRVERVGELESSIRNNDKQIESLLATNTEQSEIIANSGNIEANRENVDLISYQQKRIDELEEQTSSLQSALNSCKGDITQRNTSISTRDNDITKLNNSIQALTAERDLLLQRPSCWSVESEFPITVILKAGKAWRSEDGVLSIGLDSLVCYSSGELSTAWFYGIKQDYSSSQYAEIGQEFIVGNSNTKYSVSMISYSCNSDQEHESEATLKIYPATRDSHPQAFD